MGPPIAKIKSSIVSKFGGNKTVWINVKHKHYKQICENESKMYEIKLVMAP